MVESPSSPILPMEVVSAETDEGKSPIVDTQPSAIALDVSADLESQKPKAIASEASALVLEGSKSTNATSKSITPLQGGTYASFISAFLFAGFAAIVVLRKASKMSVKRFSNGGKALSFSYLSIAFLGAFGTYVYGGFLNGKNEVFSLIVPVLPWVFAGPLTAVALNFLLTKEDRPENKRMVFDAFLYVIVFGWLIASQVLVFEREVLLLLSFVGVILLIFPVIRFSVLFRILKTLHSEERKVPANLLVQSLMLLPLALPLLFFVYFCGFATEALTLLLLNLITLIFVFVTGVFFVISMSSVNQEIDPGTLLSKQSETKDIPLSPKSGQPSASISQPSVPDVNLADVPKEKKPIKEPVYPNPQASASAEAIEKSALQSEKTTQPDLDNSFTTPNEINEESLDYLELNVEDHGSTVIKFNPKEVLADDLQSSNQEVFKSNQYSPEPPDSKEKSVKGSKSIRIPKAPQAPKTSNASGAKPKVKPPEKPNKRL